MIYSLLFDLFWTAEYTAFFQEWPAKTIEITTWMKACATQSWLNLNPKWVYSLFYLLRKLVAQYLLTCMQLKSVKQKCPYIPKLQYFFKNQGSSVFLKYCSLNVQKINKILQGSSSNGLTDRQASLHRTFTSWVQQGDFYGPSR